MGRQIRFYMTEEDEDEFIDFVRSAGDVVILPQTSKKEVCEEFPAFRSLAGRRLGEGCIIWNRSTSPKPHVEYFEVHGGCYCVDFMQSEVVTVMRSKCPCKNNLIKLMLPVWRQFIIPFAMK